jgi:predicted house-cleaning noncanonical NTP pyrophosphatase (MazG superfamily)
VRITYNKLVRDRIPDIISAAGERPVTRILDQAAYQDALLEKLTEEAHEARQAPPDQLVAELADVLEVLQAVAQAHGMSWDHILSATAAKRSDRGAFNDRIFLEFVENAD